MNRCDHFHKDNLRHLHRFPDFFVTFRILSTDVFIFFLRDLIFIITAAVRNSTTQPRSQSSLQDASFIAAIETGQRRMFSSFSSWTTSATSHQCVVRIFLPEAIIDLLLRLVPAAIAHRPLARNCRWTLVTQLTDRF